MIHSFVLPPVPYFRELGELLIIDTGSHAPEGYAGGMWVLIKGPLVLMLGSFLSIFS
jgi:hypothetical protein